MTTNLILNGTTYDGTPITNPTHPYKPSSLSLADAKIGKTLVAYSGKRNFVSRTTKKNTWQIGWDLTNEITRLALRTLHDLQTTWTFVNQLGVSYTVQTEQDDYAEDWVRNDTAGNPYYNVKLTVREA